MKHIAGPPEKTGVNIRYKNKPTFIINKNNHKQIVMETDTKKQKRVSDCIYPDTDGNFVIDNLMFYPKEMALRLEGERIGLTCQAADLLWFLLQASHYYSTNETLVNELWPDLAKKDPETWKGRLRMAASRLRKALGSHSSVCLACVSKRGYELIMKKER